jgi:hypothetical protein
MRTACSAGGAEEKPISNIGANVRKKRPLRTPALRCVDNIKINLKRNKIGCCRLH